MHQENLNSTTLLKGRSIFTGFIAYYDNGKVIKEREDFFSKSLNKKCSTNWAEIDKEKLSALELVWHGELKARLDKKPSNMSINQSKELSPSDWFFSQNGYYDMNTRKVTVVARNIGYIEDGLINIISVIEETGIVRMMKRKA